MRKSSVTARSHSGACRCEICGDNRPFELPKDLYERFIHGEVVIFAGAGVSTENHAVYPYTLYQEVCGELDIRPEERPAFPDVMTKYCSQPDGRANLLRKIKDRLEYVRSFPELYRRATRFHSELSTLSVVEEIVTTNWDSYFEDECGATPFVTAEDFAFWKVPGRKVLKIHGSVDSYGSIVATREDYNLCEQRLTTGVLGSTLRMLLATKTIVYIGFSFSDDDFIHLQSALVAEMKGLCPQSYIVTLDHSSDARFRERNLTPIYTDGTHFVSEVKKLFVSKRQLLGDERYIGVSKFLRKILKAHDQLSDIDPQRFPDVVFGMSYQDGFIHALERILALRHTGYYSHACNPIKMAKFYIDTLGPEKLKSRKYHDAAYAEGYGDGLLFFIADDDLRDMFPMYFAFGESKVIRSLRDYQRALRRAPRVSPRKHAFAKRLIHEHNTEAGFVLHHTPFLL